MPIISTPEDKHLQYWPTSNSVGILDLEFTSWEGSLQRNWSNPWEWREIVQIGMISFDFTTFAIKDELEIFVKPAKNPILSNYFQSLTGISNSTLQSQGVTYPIALTSLLPIMSSVDLVLFNGFDGQIIKENCILSNIKYPFDIVSMYNFRPLLASSLGVSPDILVSSDLPKLAGIPACGRSHSALHDCRSIVSALAAWRNTGHI